MTEKLHQHFLTNKRILEEEVELADINEKDIVLEIGSGTGNLTRLLAKKAPVLAIEKDEKFISSLKQIKNVTVFHQDAIEFLKENHGFTKIVSNIPYYLSQPILLELLKNKWETCILLVQREFAEKAINGGKLALLVEDCCKVEIVGHVKAEDFEPTGIDSTFLVLNQKNIMDEQFWDFLESAYKMKNKNASKLENCPASLRKKKIHQLTLEEIRSIYGKDNN
jgi:16S rRNA (adenine1518-N6/adenine1519-N6)-dimethyltransferase